ncbi:MAG TPA: hypothetical protein ENO12_02865 [Thermoplasmatales archaeon]|nr:hypothetical protein [Thermoplasmatales archaeon]
MEERDNTLKTERMEAWKRKFKERIGREHFSQVQGFVVAGSIFDVLDDLGYNQQKTKTSLTDQIKHHYNVYVYRSLRYPPQSSNKKRFLEQ